MTTLLDTIKITTRYRRSVHLEQDFGKTESIEGYVVSPLAQDTSKRILDGLKTEGGNRAWTLVGPYGSGKSSLLVFLAALLGPDKELRQDAEVLSVKPSYSKHPLSLGEGKSLVPVVITGEHSSLRLIVTRGLIEAAERFWISSKKPLILSELQVLVERIERNEPVTDTEVVELALELSIRIKNSQMPGDGLCLMIDELGKLVEWVALQRKSSDIYLLQLLAEATARTDSSGHEFCVITTLHQSLDTYAEGLPRVVRNEWTKVGGRFETIPYLESPQHFTKLIAGAIKSKDKSTPVFNVVIQQVESLTSNLSLEDDAVVALGECAPLNPIVASLLGPLFRLKLGQNERSLFAFLNSNEPFGFQTYLKNSDQQTQDKPYLLDQLYDYVVANTGVRIAGSSDRTWSATEQALRRLPGNASSLDVSVLKAAALLAMVGTSANLKASQKVIALSLGADEVDVHASLERLVKTSALVFRRFRGGYQVWDGSDLDVSALVDAGRRAVAAQGGFGERLQRLYQPFPIVASRHYHQTGTLRYLVPRYVAVPHSFNDWPRSKEGDGDLLFVVPDRPEELEVLQRFIQQTIGGHGERPLIVAEPRQAQRLHEVIIEYFAADHALLETPELAGDPIARRELEERKLKAQDELEESLSRSFTSGAESDGLSWWYRGERMTAGTHASSLASYVFDAAYDQAPHISNELINRDKVSSAGAGARRALMERMFTHEEDRRLGIIGHPPELSMYLSVFESTGLHAEGPQGWKFVLPVEDRSTLKSVWNVLDQEMDQMGTQVSMDKLLDALTRPPLGLRLGLAPVLLLAYYMTKKRELFIYEDGSFLPNPGKDIVPRLLKRPATFKLQMTLDNQELDGLVQSLADELIPGTEEAQRTLFDVTKAIIATVVRLKPFAAKTQKLSQNARAVRSAIVSSRDPVRLLRELLPKALDVELSPKPSSEECRAYASRLNAALQELRNLDDWLLSQVDATLRRFFHGECTNSSFYQDMIKRAAQLDNKPFVPLIARGFVGAMAGGGVSSDTYDPGHIRLLATALMGKVPSQWSDKDLQQFEYRVMDVSRAFLAAEDMQEATDGISSNQGLIRLSLLNGAGEEYKATARNTLSQTVLDDIQTAMKDLAQKHGIKSDKDMAFGVIASLMQHLDTQSPIHQAEVNHD